MERAGYEAIVLSASLYYTDLSLTTPPIQLLYNYYEYAHNCSVTCIHLLAIVLR